MSAEPSCSPYWTAKQLDERLAGYVKRMLDEDHYLGVIEFLSRLLSSGVSLPSKSQPRGFTPSANLLLLLSTIAVHPLFTHRAASDARAEVGRRALQLLHDINQVLGPVNANYADSLYFRTEREERITNRQNLGQVELETVSKEDRHADNSKSRYSTTESLWLQADDLWSVVGWAFNCSVNLSKRWTYWNPWLAWYIDALERDWIERARLGAQDVLKNDNSRSSQEAIKDHLRESLIGRDLQRQINRTALRRVLRSILADAVTQKPTTEFGEIWPNEVKDKKLPTEEDTSTKFLNIEEGEYGDYDFDEDEDQVNEGSGPDLAEDASSRRANPPKDGNRFADIFQQGTASLGGIEALRFRQRLLALLVNVSFELPDHFQSPLLLFDAYVESLTALPLCQFAVLLSNPYMQPRNQAALLGALITALSQPAQQAHNAGIFNADMAHICRRYLPATAISRSALENAQVSLVVETMLKDMLRTSLNPTLGFGEVFGDSVVSGMLGGAVEAGTGARERKVGEDGRRKRLSTGSGVESQLSKMTTAREELQRSSERILAVLEVIESTS